ncbi:pentatricopeptide repeat-containing protein At4g02750-like [Selaginella moellendorffii]|uniref:pentatricopeptide repeat-containing protein At4g02750-like n=1 Tax=Selaginella moellendorffii TaxID=88036 RepID=UPI000D1CBD22|nr:pentatricopeptide repeat-containing protein At4g02750-like [Selaginella moellendorffii]|eukprot:XP_024537848.1 pentatricopeptide repeat-containing protein At4g02750-like [Selaginella moellendorffii]
MQALSQRRRFSCLSPARAILDAHFVRRQVVGKNLSCDDEHPPAAAAASPRLSGKSLREQLKQAIDGLLLRDSGKNAIDVGRFGSLLRRCASAKALGEGRRLHERIALAGYDRDTYLGNNLVQMYGKCGRLGDAIAAFERIETPNIYSLNTMISAFAQNGHLHHARTLFSKMPLWDAISWTAILVACAQSCNLDDARSLFRQMPVRDVVAWNAMVAAFAQNGLMQEALELFREMDFQGVGPDKVSYLSVIQALDAPAGIAVAKIIHSTIVASGEDYKSDVVLGTALVDMYGKCGSAQEAFQVFQEMPEKNVVTWTAMVAAYAQNGHLADAEAVFQDMPVKNTVSWNAMITAYAQNRRLSKAREIFDAMNTRDLNSWNIMIAMYASSSSGEGGHVESLKLFKRMVVEGFHPDKFSYVGVLDACASIPSIVEGRMIHAAVVEAGLDRDIVVGNALMNLYAKCGNLEESRAVFEQIPAPNHLVAWNTMMASYSKNGCFWEALELFVAMILRGVDPDEITFVSVIFSCSHGGRYEDGCSFFVSMQLDFGIQPVRDHFMCMIDLLARAGQLRDAEELIQGMPVEADDVAMRTLLGAYKTHGDSHRAKEGLDQIDFTEQLNSLVE